MAKYGCSQCHFPFFFAKAKLSLSLSLFLSLSLCAKFHQTFSDFLLIFFDFLRRWLWQFSILRIVFKTLSLHKPPRSLLRNPSETQTGRPGSKPNNGTKASGAHLDPRTPRRRRSRNPPPPQPPPPPLTS